VLGEGTSQYRRPAATIFWHSIIDRVVKVDKCYYLMLMILAFTGVIYVLKSKTFDLKRSLMAMIFVIYFGVHLVIEVQTRYRYFSMPFICISASYTHFLLANLKHFIKYKQSK
jgi:hypothetical protein